jgi:DNA-binding NarL/FixJ family response regulator
MAKQLILQEDYQIAMKKAAIITKGELEIVQKMAAGLSALDIARELKRSFYTVQNRIYNLRKKTGFRKNTLLIAAFKDQGLI